MSIDSTLTDNVDLSPSDRRRSDWVNQLTPSLRFVEKGAHTRFAGSIAVPILLYARTSENNYVAPEVAIAGTGELVDQFLFVDASANVSQQYQTPFGAVPNNLANATNNRYTAQSYGVSPYIRGLLPNNIDYELRDNNLWSVANGVGDTSGNAYSNELSGHITRQPLPLGWSLTYDRLGYNPENRPNERTQIARASALYQVDPTLQFSGSVGYEDNQFVRTEERGATYGAGVIWHPTDRTNVDVKWEHRFFGASYHVVFDHRTPLTVWSAQASRDITNYPSELASLPGGANVSNLLNSLLLSKLPDPAQRQGLVDQIIRDRGLPSQLTGPVTLFTEQITLTESANVTFGILGANNSVLFTVYRTHDQPLEGSLLNQVNNLLANLTDSTQTGVGAVWTHRLPGNMSFATMADWSKAVGHADLQAVTRQGSLRAVWSAALSAYTTVYVSARLQDFRSNITDGYREHALVFGLSYLFH